TETAAAFVVVAVRPPNRSGFDSVSAALERADRREARVAKARFWPSSALCRCCSVTTGSRSCAMMASRMAVQSMLLNPLNVMADPMLTFSCPAGAQAGAAPPAYARSGPRLSRSGHLVRGPPGGRRPAVVCLSQQRQVHRRRLVRLCQGRDAALAQDVVPRHVGRLLRDVRVADAAL